MFLAALRKLARFTSPPPAAPGRRRPLPGYRPRLEVLEERRLLSTLLVDDDKAQFTNAPYTSIQAAVDAAHAGDTIRVAPGTYAESVTVNKTLTIQGVHRPGSAQARSQ